MTWRSRCVEMIRIVYHDGIDPYYLTISNSSSSYVNNVIKQRSGCWPDPTGISPVQVRRSEPLGNEHRGNAGSEADPVKPASRRSMATPARYVIASFPLRSRLRARYRFWAATCWLRSASRWSPRPSETRGSTGHQSGRLNRAGTGKARCSRSRGLTDVVLPPHSGRPSTGMAHPTGLEPVTFSFGRQWSIQAARRRMTLSTSRKDRWLHASDLSLRCGAHGRARGADWEISVSPVYLDST
jgi:hypothetical protein